MGNTKILTGVESINNAGKLALERAIKKQHIGPERAKQMLAMGMIEGDLTRQTDNQAFKKGTNAACHGIFNLNTVELESIGWRPNGNIAKLDKAVRDAASSTGAAHDQAEQKMIDLSTRALNHLLNKFGELKVEQFTRTGNPDQAIPAGDNYKTAYEATKKMIGQDPAAFSDANRFWVDVQQK